MKTRTRKTAAVSKAKPVEAAKVTVQTLEASEQNPPKLFILPKDNSPEARILSLPNPVTLQPTRYLACPNHGFYEFTKVAAPKGACRSWLLAPEQGAIVDKDNNPIEKDGPNDEGYILQTPDLFIATPMDPLFLVLPALWPDSEQNYQAFYDRMFLVEEQKHRYVQLRCLLAGDGIKTLQDMLEKRMAAACSSLDTGDERLYHLDVRKLTAILWEKAEKMVEVGLPVTLEEKFVRQALDVPVLAMKREESGISLASDTVAGGLEDEAMVSAETSQENSGASSDGNISTPATSLSITEKGESQQSASSIPETSRSNDVAHLLRLRTASNFIMASYLPKDLRAEVEKRLNSPTETAIDFQPLDKHLAHIAKLKSEAVALRSISDNVSRKRGVLDDEEALEKAETKKRKKEEEETRKKSMSHGVKKLAKVNTSGMQKMSSFFAKVPAKK